MNDKQIREIFKAVAKENMVYYNEELFKSTHSNLYRTINLAMKEAYRQGELSKLKNK